MEGALNVLIVGKVCVGKYVPIIGKLYNQWEVISEEIKKGSK